MSNIFWIIERFIEGVGMFVIFRNMNEYLRIPFEGYQREDVLMDKDLKNHILKFLLNYHTSIKLNRRINIPFKQIWYPYYLDYEKINKDDDIYFVFFEGSRVSMQRDYLLFLRNKYRKAKFIYRFVNPVNTVNLWALEFVYMNYDLIISMDREDCDKYHWLYVSNTYNVKTKQGCQEEEIDVFFVGSNKGRLEQLLKIYQYLTNKGMKCAFFITDVKKSERVSGYKGIHYIKKMKYEENLQYIRKSKCLLEVVQKGQAGSTLRPFEAIVYGKKLLTNDRNIISQEYFDDKNMLYFKSVEDIDIKFIKQEMVIDRKILDKISHDILFSKIKEYFERQEEFK